ncbi:MAG: ATP-binding domain-containing protein [Burkholderiales bacterium]|nr:ATP-binding domain-containing protein [Burkholderiales bacterium]
MEEGAAGLPLETRGRVFLATRLQVRLTSRDFGEEGNAVLELAYALTVHKSQGSEFGTVILV